MWGISAFDDELKDIIRTVPDENSPVLLETLHDIQLVNIIVYSVRFIIVWIECYTGRMLMNIHISTLNTDAYKGDVFFVYLIMHICD